MYTCSENMNNWLDSSRLAYTENTNIWLDTSFTTDLNPSLKGIGDDDAGHGETEHHDQDPEDLLSFRVRVVHPVRESVEWCAVAVLLRVGLDDCQAAPPLPRHLHGDLWLKLPLNQNRDDLWKLSRKFQIFAHFSYSGKLSGVLNCQAYLHIFISPIIKI